MEKLIFGGVIALLVVALRINNKINQIVMTNEEAIAKLDAQAVKLEKVRAEVQALKDAAQADGNVSPELAAAIDRVDAAIIGVDDINEDAETGEDESQG